MYVLAQAFWFMLPAMVSNMAPVLVKNISLLDPLNKPIDGGAKLRGQPVLGANKTYRGFVAGVAIALCVGGLQWLLSSNFSVFDRLAFTSLRGIDYILLAFLLGFGALLGDSVASFVKRQLAIPPGSTWTPWDQLDYVLGAFLVSSPALSLSIEQYTAAGFVGLVLHFISVFIGYKLGIRDAPI